MRRPSLLLFAALLVACGGSSRLTHGEFVRRSRDDLRRAGRGRSARSRAAPSTSLNAAGYLGTVLSVVEKGVKQFHALRPPVRDEQSYKSFLRELDNNIDILRTLRAAAAAQDKKDYVIGLGDLHRSRLRINALERRLD